jgi:hypothetical protein
MSNWFESQSRLADAAKTLLAYFERKWKTSLQLITEEPTTLNEDDIRFGMELSYNGLWGVRPLRPLELASQLEITETFMSIFGGLADMKQKRDELRRLEAKLEQSLEELPGNVIALRKIAERTGKRTTGEEKRWMLRLDCLIESRHISEIHKMAVELHTQSFRYAFVEYRDLDRSQRMQLTELLKMGAISLFVPDILELSASEQKVLRSLAELDTIQRPLLMVGTTLTFADLRCEPSVDVEFLALLSRAYLKLTRPFSEYKDQGLIHYFLDSLSQNPT